MAGRRMAEEIRDVEELGYEVAFESRQRDVALDVARQYRARGARARVIGSPGSGYRVYVKGGLTMEQQQDRRVVLEIPRCVSGSLVLANSVAARDRNVVVWSAPNHLSETNHVLVSEAGRVVISRELFDLCRTGLVWECLGDLPRRGFVVGHFDNEFVLSWEPYSDTQPDTKYEPTRRQREASMASGQPPEWSLPHWARKREGER